MPYIAAVVRATCCGHPVAEVMLVLWALGHLIEGASGFGTGPATLTRELEPILVLVGMWVCQAATMTAALPAPCSRAAIMAALGHPPFESLVCLLIMTTWCVGLPWTAGCLGDRLLMATIRENPSPTLLRLLPCSVGPFGSSGIGIWFGLSTLDWTRAQLVRATFLVAACMALMVRSVEGGAAPLGWSVQCRDSM